MYHIFIIKFTMKRLFILATIMTLLYGCEGDTIRLSGYAVHGIDLSHYQAKINWDTVASEGIAFAFVKATEGRQHLDKKYNENWLEMKRVGIKRGAYHFFRPSIDAEEQAQNFTRAVEMEYGDLPPVVDIEEDDKMSREQVIAGLKTWLYLVEMEYSIRPIIYTHYKFYNQYIVGEFDKYPIWIAKYGDTPPRLGSSQWLFWQYGNRGKLKGIEGYIDFNVFRGSQEELENVCLSGAMLSGIEMPKRSSKFQSFSIRN
jgi:lysozyme